MKICKEMMSNMDMNDMMDKGMDMMKKGMSMMNSDDKTNTFNKGAPTESSNQTDSHKK